MVSFNFVGRTLLNRFRVESFIAAGGMGAVYRVWDLQRSVYLAMKTLHADLADDPAAYRRFKREAHDLENLTHPHIVPFYGLFEQDGINFLLEGFINGPSLKDILRQQQGRPLEIPEALAYLRALSAALGYAHALGVVHCDVKPGNVMVDTGGVIYLTDFGIARNAESTTATLGPAGTPSYMSPEQIRGEPLTPATDIYSLGVVFFEMLTGRRPFLGSEGSLENSGATAGGTTPSERIRSAHLWLPPPDPRSINPNLPPDLSAVVLRALAKDPAQRYATTGDLFEAATRAAGVTSIPDRVPLHQAYVPAPDIDRNTAAGTVIPPAPSQPSFATPPSRSRYSPAAEEPAPAPGRRSTWLPIAAALGGLALLVVLAAAFFFPPRGGSLGRGIPRSPALTETAQLVPPTGSTGFGGSATGTAAKTAPVQKPVQANPGLPTPTNAAAQAALDPANPNTSSPTATSAQQGTDQRVSPKDGMALLRVPAGPFTMGSNASPWAFEKPSHTVTLDEFWVDRTEITNAMFAKFVAETGYVTQAEKAGWGWTSQGDDHLDVPGADWRHPTGPDSSIDGRENFPVVQVSWQDAQNYCTWAGRRLLTEAEWEKAARGTDGRLYPWGSTIDCQHANYARAAGGARQCVGGLTAVDAYPSGASPYGALDMSGNVFEWVADWWQPDYYAVSPSENPQGPASGTKRVHRGGAFYNFDLQVQAPYRFPNLPDATFNSVGIRCGSSQ